MNRTLFPTFDNMDISRPLKIGNVTIKNRIILAPMAGITDLPFRMIARKFHTGLIHTEMISSQGVLYCNKRTRKMYWIDSLDKPISAQLLGKDPLAMAKAAKIMEDEGADIIDINMGCSVRKVIKQGSGSALMEDHKTACKIIGAVVRSVSIPVTVKMRKGYKKESRDALFIARVAEDAGAAALSIHGRTAYQGFSGSADWDIIGEIKQIVKIPVIGNGDVKTPIDALHRLKQGNCDAVMIGRAVLGNPWILRDTAEIISNSNNFKPLTYEERFQIIREHLQLSRLIFGDHIARKRIGKHIAWYCKGLPCAARLKELLYETDSLDELQILLENYFSFLLYHESQLKNPFPIDSQMLFREYMGMQK